MIRLLKQGFISMTLILISCIFFTGCGFSYAISSLHSSARQLSKEDAMEFTVAKTEVDPITTLNIRTRIADVELIQADSFYVEINCLYWEDAPEYELKNGKLTFDDSKCLPESYSINFNLHNSIRVFLPKDSAFDYVSIEDASGDVDITGFAAEKLEVDVAYGNLTLTEASAASADIRLSSGKSKVADFNVDDLDFSDSYGDAKFTNINTRKVPLPGGTASEECKINLSSGKVDIDGMNTATLDIINSYGDVTCEGLVVDDAEFKLSSGDLVVSQSDISKIDAENSYGNVTLKLSGPASDYSLDLDTSYGKIDVDGKRYDEHVTLDGNGLKSINANLSSGDVRLDFE